VQRFIQETSGGTHEGMTFAILLIAGLLADQHHTRAGGALAENGPCADHPEPATPAACRRFAQGRE
jgi:hypothetical protein